ncbi:hypothetical protein B0H16DRAFT_1473219 [Mycena metata]|uniref:Uncharacterized protein n=1 Tax=Mycena metata TaxID=1033252 RepID=A0AAD7HKB6_9AGAR|nr:hypothetical protein B0H16DRAFT_1473219 [Mycena metata]
MPTSPSLVLSLCISVAPLLNSDCRAAGLGYRYILMSTSLLEYMVFWPISCIYGVLSVQAISDTVATKALPACYQLLIYPATHATTATERNLAKSVFPDAVPKGLSGTSGLDGRCMEGVKLSASGNNTRRQLKSRAKLFLMCAECRPRIRVQLMGAWLADVRGKKLCALTLAMENFNAESKVIDPMTARRPAINAVNLN